MQHEIYGEFAQYAQLTFNTGEDCWAGKGAIMSYVDGINWKLRVPGGPAPLYLAVRVCFFSTFPERASC